MRPIPALMAVAAVSTLACSSSQTGPGDGGGKAPDSGPSSDAGVPPPDGGAGSDAGWATISVPVTSDLCCVRSTAPSNVWIAGSRDLLQWNGLQWTAIPGVCNPTLGIDAGIQALWVDSATDAWIGLFTQKVSVCRFMGGAWTVLNVGDNRAVNALWGSSASDIWGADDAPSYLGHFDGVAWTHTGPNLASAALWGSGPGDVWSAGFAGVDHWSGLDGGVVTLDGLGTPSAQPLSGIWGTSPRDVWAVGAAGTVMHRNSVGWSMPATAPTSLALYGVWGSGTSDVWAVGDQGVILHYDGSAWTPVASPTSNALRSIWGTSATDVWAVGDRGTVLHLGP